MTDPSNLNPCNEPGYIKDLNVDEIPPFCRTTEADASSGTIDHTYARESLKDVAPQDLSWLEDATQSKLREGQSALCDPQQTGHIINEQGLAQPNRSTIYRYQKSIRGTNEAMKDLFSDIIAVDESGKAHQIPIRWATQEKAIAWILQDNTRKDDSLVADRVRLPILSIHMSGAEFGQNRYVYHKALDYLRTPELNWKPGFTVKERYERDTIFGISRGIPLDMTYTMYAWTMYEADMDQIMTQVITKFSRLAYIRVRGIPWEIGVRLDSITNNVNIEPGDQSIRVFKYQFTFTAESFVAQPIVRKKAVLKTRIEVTNALIDEEVTEVLTRLEEAVKDFQE